MSMQTIVQVPGRWFSFDGHSVSISDTRPRLENPAWVFCEFDGGVSSVMSLEGSPAHAVALIQKRLRADGMIDGEGKILIHKHRSIGAGYQTLFTAVPLEAWQQTYAWAEAQSDHCLLIPLTSLMWNAIKTGEGLVLQAGRQFSVLVLRKHDIIFRSSMAYSEDVSDMSMTIGALAQQVADDLARNDEDGEPVTFHWCPLLLPANAEAGTDHTALAEIFSVNTGSQVKQVPHKTFVDGDGGKWISAIEWMRSKSATRIAVNPLPSRLGYLAEWALPLASAASLVIAIALSALGARWTLNANEANERAALVSQEIATTEQNTLQLQSKGAMPAGFSAALDFVGKAKQLADAVDPVSGLELIKDAAQDQVRILRVRVEGESSPTGNAPHAETPRTLRVDGMVDADRGTPGAQVALFVERLRRHGFEPTPIDPQTGGNSRAGGGVFSYALKRPVLANLDQQP